MGIILDTSLPIAGERGKFDIAGFLAKECAGVPVFITAITVSELLHGWERAPAGKKKKIRKQFVEDFIGTYPVLNFDKDAARKHAHLWAALESKGNMIGAHDLLIAAIALNWKHQVATLNEKEFRQVSGLKLKPTKKYVIN